MRRPMSRPADTFRFVAVASLVAIVGSLLAASAPAVLATGPIQIRGHQTTVSRQADTLNRDPGSYREVDVSQLPQGTAKASADNPVVVPKLTTPAPQTALGGSPPPPVLAPTSSTPAASEPRAWNGLAASGTVEPPDSGIAAGPNHVVQVAATGVRITNRSGSLLNTVSLKDFFGISANPTYEAEAFNPRILYDSLHARWLAVGTSFDCDENQDTGAANGTGYINIAYSKTANPTGTWGILTLEFPDFVPDELGLGTSTDKIVVTTDVVNLVPGGGEFGCRGEGFAGTEIDAMVWSEVLGEADTVTLVTWHTDFKPGADLPNEFQTWQPSRQTPATSERVYLIANRFDGGFEYAMIIGNPTEIGFAVLDINNLTTAGVVVGFLGSPDPQQPGSPSPIQDAANGLPTDAIWQDDRLVVSSSFGCDPSGGIVETRACVRVTELNTTTATPSLNQDFLIAQGGTDLYMGGAALALNGDLHVVWTRSSAAAGQYPSSQTAVQLATDSRNTIGERSTIAAGTGTYPGTQWGDYAGIAVDPLVPDAVWQANQYSAGASYWATHVSQLQATGSSYTPIPPLRVLDTRPAYEIGLSGRFSANVPRNWQVASIGTIPADAIAVTGNVTVTNQTAGGYLSVTPTGTVNPTSSSINFPLGDTRANNVTVPLAPNGKLAATYKAPGGQTTHLIFDVTGYFTAGDADATYNPLPPVRALDSRVGTGLTGAFEPDKPRQLNITGLPEIPADATAVTGNLTVVGQTKAGFLSITKTSIANPTTSTLNFPLGDTRANGISVPLNGAGGLWIVYKAPAGASTHVILDVTGYYRDDPSGLLYYPLAPRRTMDTRPGAVGSGLVGPFNASGPRRLQVVGRLGIPTGAEAVTGNLTVVNQTAAGYVSATLNSEVDPTTSVLNFPIGDTRANGVTLPLNAGGRSWFVYKAPSGKTTHLILDVSGYFR